MSCLNRSKAGKKTKQNKTKQKIKKLIKVVVEAIIVIILITIMKIGNNSKSAHVEKTKPNNNGTK